MFVFQILSCLFSIDCSVRCSLNLNYRYKIKDNLKLMTINRYVIIH